MPISSSSLTRRQRVIVSLVQDLADISVIFRGFSNESNPAYPDQKIRQQSTKKVGSQVTDSEDHSGWRRALKDADSRSDIGGNFFTQKRYVEGFPSYTDTANEWNYYEANMFVQSLLQGPVWAIDARLHSFPESIHSSDDQLDELGATAVARCRPTNSAANVGTAIAELVREGIPKLAVNTWKRRARKPDKLAADEYLAYQFGLKPLGDEIGTFAAQVLQSDRLLAQYERDAGRVVRRRYEFPTETHEEVSEEGAGYPAYYGGPVTGIHNPALTYDELCRVKVERSSVVKRWFSGAFVYQLPTWYDARNEISRKALLAKEILGLDLDEEVLWNLTPWSWAVDWFTNAGDVISNASSVREDGLIMPYGYMMEHSIVKHTYSRSFPRQFRYGAGIDSRVSLVTETKIRRKANPFGFGITWDALDAFQMSILASLGISRKR